MSSDFVVLHVSVQRVSGRKQFFANFTGDLLSVLLCDVLLENSFDGVNFAALLAWETSLDVNVEPVLVELHP